MDFLGIKLSDKVPDENTIWMFKEKLKEHNLSQVLFDLFTGYKAEDKLKHLKNGKKSSKKM